MLGESDPECHQNNKKKKRPDVSSIYKFIYKELKNPDITIEVIKKRLPSLTNNNKIKNKPTK